METLTPTTFDPNPNKPVAADPAPAMARRAKAIFTGNAKDYFGIWIVNILLNIVTLGIYGAWAKVRTNRYMMGHTKLDGHAFKYLAEPIQLLKGRILAIAFFLGYMVVTSFNPELLLPIMLIMIFAAPWIINQSLRFSMRMTSYRNLRFGFEGTYWKSLLNFVIFPTASMFTLYMALPAALKKMDEYMIGNLRYGDRRFETTLSHSKYFRGGFSAVGVGILVMLVTFAAVFGAMVTLGSIEGARDPVFTLGDSEYKPLNMLMIAISAIGYFVAFIVSQSVYQTVVRNHTFDNTVIAGVVEFESNVDMRSFVSLGLTNAIAIVCSFGLAFPWARIRTVKYLTSVTAMTVKPGADAVMDRYEAKASSFADEASEFFDMDLSFT